MYGRWQVGQRPAHDYALVARETAKAMRLVDPRIELVAVGHEDGPQWNATVLAETAPYIDYLALHVYVGSDDTAEALAQPLLLERLARQHAAVIDLVLTDLGLDKRIGLAFDEWNVWYRAVPERVRATHKLDEIDDPAEIRRLTGLLATEEPYNLRDALAVACCLNALLRCADIVDIANLAQLVNAIAPLRTTPTGLVRLTTYYPLAYCLQVKVLSHMSSTRISAARGGKGSVAAYTPYFHEPFAPTHGCRYAMRLMRLCNMAAIRLA